MSQLRAEHITKYYGKDQVLKGLSLNLNRGQTLSILGRSGCGKTTLLKILAGLEQADEGKVLLKGEPVLKKAAPKRGIVYLYQEDLLFPHMSVFENIAFGLRVRDKESAEVQNLTMDMMNRLGLIGKENQMPHELSGGQKQRVAFGRALIINPEVLLLDEPFGSLDTETRSEMQQFFKEVAAEFDITTVFVTHDLKEALLMGDQIALMQNGHLNMYESKQAFIDDPVTGVRSEQEFWEQIESKS